MSLLPGSLAQFRDRSYWANFFRTRRAAFEWYGEPLEVLPLFERLAANESMRDREVLHVGCGNSMLPTALLKAGVVTKMTNIDFDTDTIRRMQRVEPRLEWREVDVRGGGLSCLNKKFSTVIDKGFLDAFLADDAKDTTLSIAREYFDSLIPLLEPRCRVLIISLCQRYIVEALLKVFYLRPEFSLRVIPFSLTSMQSEYQPTMLVLERDGLVTDSKLGSLQVDLAFETLDDLDLSPGNILQLPSVLSSVSMARTVRDRVRPVQGGVSRCVSLTNGMEVGIYDSQDFHEGTAAIVVPLGKEASWLFSQPAGNETLCKQLVCGRLLLLRLTATLATQPAEEVMKWINAEVAPVLRSFALSEGSIPVLALDAQLNKKLPVDRVCEAGWAIEIYDVQESDMRRRLMVFESHDQVAQTEIALDSNLRPLKRRLLSEYLHGFATCLRLVPSTAEIAVLGLGGAAFPNFVATACPYMTLRVVDIDDRVVDLCHRHFFFEEGERCSVHVQDAAEFVALWKSTLDAIFVDVNNDDPASPLVCPAPTFLEHAFLQDAKSKLTPDGLLVVNMVTQDDKLLRKAVQSLRTLFQHVSLARTSDVNVVVVASEVVRSDALCEASMAVEVEAWVEDGEALEFKCGSTVL
ncbi:MAG: uncharacterized protein KVP18_002451 [Porospora cf. gigantea A]|uniref:uncharacterized protein n=1 Tax=Porospora cf. gigantea A TaxID=2853593 RepID=UPI00355A2EF3|nr:MAG: hypothetical protein KVP18_002451 [Porospora cf. gigantea A]